MFALLSFYKKQYILLVMSHNYLKKLKLYCWEIMDPFRDINYIIIRNLVNNTDVIYSHIIY